MMGRVGMIALAAVFAGATMTGNAGAQYRPAAPLSVLTDSDDGRVLNLPVGAEVVVRLPENEGTLYRWMLRTEDRVEQIGASTVDGPDNTGIYGGRRYRTFRIRVREAGRFPLIFALRTTQPGDQQPARRVLFTVNVADDDRYAPSRRDDDRYGPDRRDDRGGGRYYGPPLVLGEADARRRIEVAYGRDVVIRVAADPNPDYRWSASSSPTNFDVVERLDQRNGAATVRLRPTARGHAFVSLSLMRSRGAFSSSTRILNYNFDVR